jgi:hypothetical protein
VENWVGETYRIQVGIGDNLVDLDIDRSIILKLILAQMVM